MGKDELSNKTHLYAYSGLSLIKDIDDILFFLKNAW